MNTRRWILGIITIFWFGQGELRAAADTATTKYFTPFPAVQPGALHEATGSIGVITDQTGKVSKAWMALSTGYQELDNSSLEYVRSHWHGPPNHTWTTTLDFRVITSRRQRIHLAGPKPLWFIPSPKSPAIPEGSSLPVRLVEGVVSFSTKPDGTVASAKMITSTGNAKMDSEVIQYVHTYWKGPANSTKAVPVTFVTLAPQASRQSS